MTAFPQYAKTKNLDVIGAVQSNLEGVKEFNAKASAFAVAQGVENGSFYPSRFAGTHRVRAIGGDTKPTTGRWKQGYGGVGWLPFKNNPLHDELMAIEFDEQALPGLPSMLHGRYLPTGQQVLYAPHPFLWEGEVYVGFSGAPMDEELRVKPEDGGWEEILGSVYMAAVEGYNASLKAS